MRGRQRLQTGTPRCQSLCCGSSINRLINGRTKSRLRPLRRCGSAQWLTLWSLSHKKVADEVRISPFDSFRTKEAREWRAEQEQAGKIVMTSQEGEILEGVVSASCLAIADCLQGGEYDVEVEVTAVFNDVELCGLIDLVGAWGRHLVGSQDDLHHWR